MPRCARRFDSLPLLAVVLPLLAVKPAAAQPSLPWTPSPVARHQIELLVDDGGLELTVTQWPLPAAAVGAALDALPKDLPPALDRARTEVRRELLASQGSRLSLAERGRGTALIGFGDDATSGRSVGLRAPALLGSTLALQLGGRVDAAGSERSATAVRLEDSALVGEAFGLQAEAWSHRSWWGPGWQDSLVLGNNAPALNGFGLRRASAGRSESPWLAWLGPWHFEMFLAQSEDVQVPARPYLLGQRLSLRPWPDIELAFTRTAQWGGGGRQQSVKSFVKMLFGLGVNANDPNQQQLDPANEMAGYDLRWRCPAGTPCAVYAQLIGEDQAGVLPSRMLGLYGVESWSADGSQRYYAELAETGCKMPIGNPALRPCAYRNYAYPEGYTSAGRWLGAGIGPDSRVLTLGWLDAASTRTLRLHVGRIGSRIGDFTATVRDPAHAGSLLGVSARQTFDWGPASWTPQLDWSQVRTADGVRRDTRLALDLQLPLDGLTRAGATRLGSALNGTGSGADGNSLGQALLVSTALVAGSALIDRPVDDFARTHGDNPATRGLNKAGSAVPVLALGAAGASWLLQRGSTQGDLAFASLEAGGSALAVATVSKLAVDRSRPNQELGPGHFGGRPRSDSAFPSGHTTVAWAVLTPYAKYYDAPWLYGLAALTNAGRVIGRAHWVSDTVAGAALGYYTGDWFYRRSTAAGDPSPSRLWISPQGLYFQTRFQ